MTFRASDIVRLVSVGYKPDTQAARITSGEKSFQAWFRIPPVPPSAYFIKFEAYCVQGQHHAAALFIEIRDYSIG
jgi:hypothetical protein